jgi:hypothetical protein
MDNLVTPFIYITQRSFHIDRLISVTYKVSFFFFYSFCAEVDKFLSPLLLIYLLMYELMICVPLYQLVLVSKTPHNLHRNPNSSHNSVCPFLAYYVEQGVTAQASFLDCQVFLRILWHQKSHYRVHSGSLLFHTLSHLCPFYFSLCLKYLFRIYFDTFSDLTIRGSNPGGGEIFHTRPERSWDQSSLYTMGSVSFPWLHRPGHGVDHPPRSMFEFKERVELHIYSRSGPSWSLLGWTLPFYLYL